VRYCEYLVLPGAPTAPLSATFGDNMHEAAWILFCKRDHVRRTRMDPRNWSRYTDFKDDVF
jgi:hypothetical protein